MSNQPKPDAELAKVTLGLPGVAGAEIPVRRSLLSSIRKMFTRAPDTRLFAVPCARTQVWATQDDEGTLDVYLSLLNMSPHEAQVEHLFLERVVANGNDLALMAPMFTPPTNSAPRFNVQKVYFRVPLTAPAIRLLLRVVQKAQNLLSTPRVELTVIGSLDVAAKGKRVRVQFTVASHPELAFQNPSARA